MVTPSSMDPASWLRQQLEHADVDLLREMVRTFAEALMSADVDGVCGAAYGQVSTDRINHRNGYRPRDWDTRTGTIELAIPKPSCAKAATSRRGCWSRAAAPSKR